jgi:hypothetical protein
MQPIQLSPTANWIGSLLCAGLLVWFGLQVIYLNPTKFARYFHTGYQTQRGTIVAMPVEVHRAPGRGSTHGFVVQLVVATNFGESRVNLQPDNGYTVRGFPNRGMALEDAKRIGKIGDEVEFLVNADRTDSFFPMDSQKLFASIFMSFVAIAFSFIVAACLILRCLWTLAQIPGALRQRRLALQESRSSAVVRRRSRRSDFMEHS